MVSIKYFCGVGEFCSLKSIPWGSLSSNTGIADATAAAISTAKQPIWARRFSISSVPDVRSYAVPQRFMRGRSKQKLQGELNQTRVGPLSCAGNHAEVLIVR